MSLEKENKRLREQLEEANKLAATLALLLDEAYNELDVDSGKEVGRPKFEAFYVDCTQEQYPEVQKILEAQGHELYGADIDINDYVKCTNNGRYFASELRHSGIPSYTLSELREKYGLTT